ncbi:MAG TPA: hypothetical protein PLN93_11255, partial [Vicinamibacterales bacterium]|nr:hypothetical protein [Vicinamibacterales bacterium]
ILPNLSHADHERLAREFAEKASKSNADWTRAIDAAVKKYGDGDGRLISGIYRNHFPESVKAKLRALAWATSDLHSASFAHYKASGKRAPYPYTIR